MANIHLIVPTYNQAQGLEDLYCSTHDSRHSLHWHLFVHSHDPDVERVCSQLPAKVYWYRENRGLARSWNEGIRASNDADAILIINDDILFGAGDTDRLIEMAMSRRDLGIVTVEGYDIRYGRHEDLGFSCFAINPIAISQIGYFDENFVPAYYEDMDYLRRLKLAGIETGMLSGTSIRHQHSATIWASEEAMQSHLKTFEEPQDYYFKKWGGLPGQETFNGPFNQ